MRPRPASANTSCPAVCMCQAAFRAPAANTRRPTVYPVVSRVVVLPVKFGAGPSTPRWGEAGAGAAPCWAYAVQTLVSAIRIATREVRTIGLDLLGRYYTGTSL